MNRKGFTLIELMVVVLIIGILSSIALPQYQKAIKKARVAEAVTVGKKFLEAEKVYFLENQEYTEDLSKLRVTFPQMKNWTIAGISTDSTGAPQVAMGVQGTNNMNGTVLIFHSGYAGSNGRPFVGCILANDTNCSKWLPCPANERATIANPSADLSNGAPYCPL